MHECDLVMKGGVTSGTVYPKAIVRLAKAYRFRSIGGTSAGAIAAAAAAAAEYRRQKSGGGDFGGFDELGKLPEKLGEPGSKKMGPTLLELFQPQPRMRALFGFLLSFLGSDRTREGKAKEEGLASKIETWLLIGRVCLKAMRHFPSFALLGLALAVLLAWLLGLSFEVSWRLAALAVFLFVGASVAAFYGAWRAVQKIPSNGFGLCRGFQPSRKGQPEDGTHLTPWLNHMIQRSAGLAPDGVPLTFGELDGQRVELRVMTSNLCYGHPHRLPFGRGQAWQFFKKSEWSQYFPKAVMDHLERHPPQRAQHPATPTEKEYAAAVRRLAGSQDLLPLPEDKDLPVIVAVRLSLSFPILLAALPIYLLDPRKNAADPARKCWFSDGGISSNFPLHFFDGPVPGRPTFAINLLEVESVASAADRVRLPRTNLDGLAHSWKEIPENKGPTAALAAFLFAIFNVMQNWRDNSLLRLPGYRDRVASVCLEPHQGGLNLNMPKPLIAELAQYGQDAADELALHFLPENAQACREQNIETTWENHRWVRMLSTLAGLERLVDELASVWKAPAGSGGTYADLLDPAKTPTPPSYEDFNSSQRQLALDSLTGARAAIEACRQQIKADSMARNTPRPPLHFRLTSES